MTSMARQITREQVLAHLREAGPQTREEIQRALRLTKRQTEDALWLIRTYNEADWATNPDGTTRVPLAYEVPR